MKSYLSDPIIWEQPRFKDQYIMELIELVNDEEGNIKIEAIEILSDLLEHVDKGYVEKDFVAAVLDTMTVDIQDIVMRLAKIIGKVVYKMSQYELHIAYKDKFIGFYQEMYHHKEIEMRRHAAYNLPCFNHLYYEYQEENGIDF